MATSFPVALRDMDHASAHGGIACVAPPAPQNPSPGGGSYHISPNSGEIRRRSPTPVKKLTPFADAPIQDQKRRLQSADSPSQDQKRRQQHRE